MFIGCSGSKPADETLKLQIMTEKADSWVNLMPGSKPSFFISGSIKIRNDEEISIDSIRLLLCNVLQEGKKLYVLHPSFSSSDGINTPLNPGSEKIYTFNLPPGTPIKKELNTVSPISLELIFSALNKINLHVIDSIQVVKTY
jgi:hypothetical protein